MQIKKKVAYSILVVFCGLMIASCTKSELPLTHVTEDAERSINKFVKMFCRQSNYNYEDTLNIVPEILGIALQKASLRYKSLDNYKVIPLYAQVYYETKRDWLRLEFVGLGKEDDWRQTDEIWIMLQRNKGDMCEIFETSISNIEQGGSSQWNEELKCGRFGYKCVNPLLGYETLSNEEIYKSIEAGDIHLYIMLSNGRYRGRRIGKTTRKMDDWMKYLASEKDDGLVVELIKIASGNGKILFEVR